MHLAPKPSFRGWSHIVAFVAAITLCPILISSSGQGRSLATFYSLAVVALFGVSSLYHGFSWSARTHDLLRRLDHATIFVTIAATYTPIFMVFTSAFCCRNRFTCRVDRSIVGSISDDFLANCSSTDSHHPFHNCWVVRVAGHSQILDNFKHIRFHLVATWRSVPHNWRNRLWIKKA